MKVSTLRGVPLISLSIDRGGPKVIVSIFLDTVYFIPVLLSSGDPELRIYGQKLCENTLTPHSLRHWFTVQLVLRGAALNEVQYWRGDSNPQSALEYLQNKGDLARELKETDTRLLALLMQTGEELNGG